MNDNYTKYWKILNDFREYTKRYLKIRDEAGSIVPFNLNDLQLHVLSIIEDLVQRKIPIRLIILKCRQTGISTLIEAYLFWRTNLEFNQKALIMGHEKNASINLFDMYQRYYENIPREIQPSIDTNQRERKLTYAVLKNEIEVQTAGANVDSTKAGTGRSGTYQYIHATECAFYPDYKTTFLGLLQASKKAKMIVLETTANGYNEFRNEWVDAINGITDYIPIFLAWIDFKDYSKDLSEVEKERLEADLGANPRYNSYSGEEDNLIKVHGCSLQQLNWRRWAINNLCKGEVDSFHQEYPTTWQEAFISSGSPVFNSTICHKNLTNSKKPFKTGDLIPIYIETDEYKKIKDTADYRERKKFLKSVEFVENTKGMWKIWTDFKIEEGEQNVFASGWDVAEGLAQGDFSAGTVLDRRTNEVCMTFHGHIDPDLLGEEQDKMRIYLKNKVYVGTEVNNHGLTTVNSAFKLGVPQYYRQTFDEGIGIDKSQLGFKTTAQTKPFMINDLNEWIREDLFKDYDKEFWSECITFVRNDRGQMSAQGKDKDTSAKCFDDRVISRGIMIQVSKWMSSYRPTKEIPKPLGNRGKAARLLRKPKTITKF